MAGLGLSGLASGVDTAAIVEQLMALERQGKTRLQLRQTSLTRAADHARGPQVQARRAQGGRRRPALEHDVGRDPDRRELGRRARRGRAHGRRADRRLRRQGDAARGLGAEDLRLDAEPSASQITLRRRRRRQRPDHARHRGRRQDRRRRDGDQRPRRPARLRGRGRRRQARPLLARDRRRGDSPPPAASCTRPLQRGRRPRRDLRAQRRRPRRRARRTWSRTRSRACASRSRAPRPTPSASPSALPRVDRTKVKDGDQVVRRRLQRARDRHAREDEREEGPGRRRRQADYNKGAFFGDTGLNSMLSKLRTAVGQRLRPERPRSALDDLRDIGISTGKAGASVADAKAGLLHDRRRRSSTAALEADAQAVQRPVRQHADAVRRGHRGADQRALGKSIDCASTSIDQAGQAADATR